MTESNNNNWLLRFFNVHDNELPAVVCSFLFIFILMSGYFLLRPMRDAMASDWTDAEVSWLWTLNFFISTIIVAMYGVVVSKVDFKKLVPSIYLFFSASFVVFYFSTSSLADSLLVKKSFYVWISVYALFHVSVFWSFMADTFSKEQATRLFSVFAAGATLGAATGGAMSATMAQIVGERAMVIVAASLVLLTVPLVFKLQKQKVDVLGNGDLTIDVAKKKIGGNPIGGFKAFFTNPYLLAIGCFIILYTGVGSFVYFFQKNLLADFTNADRISIYGVRDFISNMITFVLAFFVTGRIVPKFGMPTALALMPLFLIIGMGLIAISPIWFVAVAVWVASRAGNYGLTKPAREMLFTQLSREDQFKTKPVIDIVAYRGGDVMMGWLFTLLSTGLGLSIAMIAVVGASMMAVWTALGVFLGRIYERS